MGPLSLSISLERSLGDESFNATEKISVSLTLNFAGISAKNERRVSIVMTKESTAAQVSFLALVKIG